MGLGTKIKEALTGDHHDHQTSPTTSGATSASKPTGTTSANYKTPGTFPTDDLPQRHSDGKEYTAPHGTALSDAKWKETAAQAPVGTGSGTTSGAGISSTGTQRKRLSKNPDDYDAVHDVNRDSAVGVNPSEHASSNSAYWGDLSHGGQRAGTHDLPERSRFQEATGSSTTGVAGRHQPSEAVGGGAYNASPAQHSHTGAGNVDPTESSHFGDSSLGSSGRHTGATTGHHDHFAGPTGVGIHSSPTAGNPGQYSSQTGPSIGATHNPLSSSSNYDQQRAPISQHDGSGHSHVLAGAGAAAGVGAAAAGYGAHEYSHHNKQSHAVSGSDGVPRSSMLDPEPGLGSNSSRGGQYTSATTSSHPQTTGYNESEGSHGPHSSRTANAIDPRVDSDRDHRGVGSTGVGSTGVGSAGAGYAANQSSGAPTNINTSNVPGSSPAFGSSASPTQSASSSSGRKHFGPGHEGAKVMHACQHCGRDNDISQYFSKDVVYRLGQ